MAEAQGRGTDRRAFLQAGALAAAGSAVTTFGEAAQQPAADRPEDLPRRKLGKTGVEVTILEQGTVLGPGFDRIMRTSYAGGVRAFDTAKVYRSEPLFKKWFAQAPEVRKQIFLVTKDMVRTPSQMRKTVDERLSDLGTDYIDLYLIHGLGDEHPLDQAIAMVKSKELAETADALRKSGKARFIGFSTHHKDRAAILQAAAGGGIVDAIMLQYHPWLDRESALNKAIDACWKKDIGLISMKQIASHNFGDAPKGDILKDVVAKVPMLKERNLSPFQGLLHAIWTDERIACVCTSMRNTDQIRQNIDAARRYEPVKAAEIERLRDVLLAAGPTMCADCDGRCSAAGGTAAELGNITRFLTYHEHHGDRAEARRQFGRLSSEARDWSGADLEAARAACPNRLDFARLLPEAERLLS
ncbi:2,5-diketo-D-gluconic acid reductase B [Aquisphaera giovannonii]|uniref:2,5-diketo-D-gluconic acid reductase B n=1 Tax=Aquisphaera giovannonii TaxID=406548 RepID=A0A5B9VZK5_9BACT|nr:aldo/keto reductase [Aquisphaera giovannonii]QEH33397.1 2,5-diketo-D-gluconic acid reductase B [Aquisphaera giovannonii]